VGSGSRGAFASATTPYVGAVLDRDGDLVPIEFAQWRTPGYAGRHSVGPRRLTTVPDQEALLDRLRAICLSLPEATEGAGVGNPWIGISVEVDPDWDFVAELIEQSYRMTAPRKLIARMEDGNR